MRVAGEYTIAAPRNEVWAALLDPEVLAGTLPGFQRLERVDEHTFKGALALGVGPVQGRFDGRVELSDLVPPESYRLEMRGRGASGFVDGAGRVWLEDADGGTLLGYDVEMQVGGKIAGVGQRLLEMVSRTLTKQALQRLETAILARVGSGADGER